MENVKVPGAQCDNVGESQGFEPISIRHEEQSMTYADGRKRLVPVMVTMWKPTMEELHMLENGAVLVLELIGQQWPPSKLYVDIGEPQGNA